MGRSFDIKKMCITIILYRARLFHHRLLILKMDLERFNSRMDLNARMFLRHREVILMSKKAKDIEKDEKRERKEGDSEMDLRCCYIADPCDCYVDPCGCYVDPCCC